jgi:hypothetical protein
MASVGLRLWRCYHGLRTLETTYTITQTTAKAVTRSMLKRYHDINAYYVLYVVFCCVKYCVLRIAYCALRIAYFAQALSRPCPSSHDIKVFP